MKSKTCATPWPGDPIIAVLLKPSTPVRVLMSIESPKLAFATTGFEKNLGRDAVGDAVGGDVGGDVGFFDGYI